MKNKFHLASVALILGSLFSIISCSKDKIEPVGGSGSSSNTVSAGRNVPEIQQFLDHDALTTGALVIEISPAEAKAVVTVYNDVYNSGPIGVNTNEGLIRLEELEPGTYNVQIKPINTEYAPLLITDVVIVADTKTYLGKIILSN